MQIKRLGGGKVVVMPEGRIDLSNSHLLQEKLQMLCEEGFNIITLDFTQVASIDSSGLGKLLLFQRKLKEQGGEVRIINISSEYIRGMFEMIELGKVIKIENSPGSGS